MRKQKNHGPVNPDSLSYWVDSRLKESVMGDMPPEKRSILSRLITLELIAGRSLTMDRCAVPGIQASGTFRMVLARITRAYREAGHAPGVPELARAA